jgi:hypothetical protein
MEIQIPVQLPMLDLEQEIFRTTENYSLDPTNRYETVHIKIDDILHSPDPDAIFIDAIRYELIDYGYWY